MKKRHTKFENIIPNQDNIHIENVVNGYDIFIVPFKVSLKKFTSHESQTKLLIVSLYSKHLFNFPLLSPEKTIFVSFANFNLNLR